MRAQGVWSYIALVAALLLTMHGAASLARAHANVESSVPANGATVDAGLTRVVITFTEEVSVDQSSAQLARDGGAPLEGVAVAVDRANRKVMTLTTPPLAEGTYTVKWRAVTEDDNAITNGTLSFIVTGAISTPLPTLPPEPSSTATTAPSSTPTAIPTATSTIAPPTPSVEATPTATVGVPTEPGFSSWGVAIAVVILVAVLIAALGMVRLTRRR